MGHVIAMPRTASAPGQQCTPWAHDPSVWVDASNHSPSPNHSPLHICQAVAQTHHQHSKTTGQAKIRLNHLANTDCNYHITEQHDQLRGTRMPSRPQRQAWHQNMTKPTRGLPELPLLHCGWPQRSPVDI